MQCPICANALEGGELVMVCTPCHRGLVGGTDGGLSLHTTGEFRVPTSGELEQLSSPGERPSSAALCSWCGKGEPQVRKLLGRGSVALCEECVALCVDILDAELGTWR